MAYYPDLHNKSMLGDGERLRTVGWLHPDYAFTQGDISDNMFRAVLEHHVSTAFEPFFFLGWHDCEFCDASKGYTNLIIPTVDAVYVAPEMIVHYIDEHGYLPPTEFIKAVVDCPAQDSPEYMALMKPYMSYFNTRGSNSKFGEQSCFAQCVGVNGFYGEDNDDRLEVDTS